MNIKNQILDAIDDINIITAECEYNTICEMYNSYDKASMILEYYEGEDVDAFNVFDDTHSFYQESSVSDKMKKSGAKYNTFMKIITFIPRLAKALFQTIKEKFKKIKPPKELQKAPKEVKEKLTTVFDKKKDKKKRIATVASLILGAGVVGVATGVGVHKLRVRNELENELTEVSNASDENKLDEVIDSSFTSQNTQEKVQEPTPEVEKIAKKIVNNIDNNLDDINKRYKALVNKLYSHDSTPLPPEDKQSIGVEFNNKKDDIAFIYDKSSIGNISFSYMYYSLNFAYDLLYCLARTYGDDVNKIDEEINEIFEKFKNRKKENYRHDIYSYFSEDKLRDFMNRIEDFVKTNEKIADMFNQRSDKDKELLMSKPSVQNAIKTLNDESKFYHDIFYEFLSLCGEMTKLIDNTYSGLKVKASDKYKFDENAEKLSKINTDIPTS